MKLHTQKFYFSRSSETANEWTGGGYYQIVWSLELFWLKLVLWRKHR